MRFARSMIDNAGLHEDLVWCSGKDAFETALQMMDKLEPDDDDDDADETDRPDGGWLQENSMTWTQQQIMK